MQQQKKKREKGQEWAVNQMKRINNDKNGRDPPTLDCELIKSPAKDLNKKYYKNQESYKNSFFFFFLHSLLTKGERMEKKQAWNSPCSTKQVHHKIDE